ncbi:hypothetical protein BDV95DRAFT_499199 [Massariosphaeria phaeospora]|uniref:Fungal-specific transcription factor domain-containing protein n=1 Tax=Massariosphaeria phaeospora TaxID=100035 RepID=A0A7C8IBI7_9PLEO|nr:hypothetical protein BDV95DRAFT_499199 [Massariosphaeria phaeospora]
MSPAPSPSLGQPSSTTSPYSSLAQHSSTSPSYASPDPSSTAASSTAPLPFPRGPGSVKGITLTRDEALIVHHYTEQLGRWLDCTDAARQFTLRIPDQLGHCDVLVHSVLSFAARHRRDTVMADSAYQRCIELLINRLNEDSAALDETFLSAIVILRFFEQLNVSSITGSDHEQHLAGLSALLRASQGPTVDPSAPTLREAAFWVYVRQCLYNATVNQQPPDLDITLQLVPLPSSLPNSHFLADLRRETAYANQITWICACVIHFCFSMPDKPSERACRTQQWERLRTSLEAWLKERPASFNPIWEGPATNSSVFPEIWFSADWHLMASSFYHFACILLLNYRPGPKFAVRNVGGGLSDIDNQILDHARIMCGSCKSAASTVPNLITLCHSVFIWGPILSHPEERIEVIQLLSNLENDHVWPTTWIVNELKSQWAMP